MTESIADDSSTDTGSTRRTVLGVTVASGLLALGTGPATAQDGGNETGGDGGAECFALSSSAFGVGELIPTEFTCDGENASPPLAVSGVPENAGALALVVDDPDAPRDVPFTHWLAWNLPTDVSEIPRGVPTTETADALGGATQGANDGGDLGYTGPCPPEGTHTYRFRLYALGSELDLEAGAERQSVVRAVADEAVAVALLTGEYSREDGG